VNTSSGTASPGTPGNVNFSIDPELSANLIPNTYYGTIRVTSPDAVDSPLGFSVVLDVAPAATPVKPDPSPAGLVFFAANTAGSSPAPQAVRIYASSNTPVSYQASTATDNQAAWLSVSPSTGTASSGAPGASTVSVGTNGLAPGVYSGGVSYAFSSAAVRTVNVTLIVHPVAAQTSVNTPGIQASPSVCTATRLVPVQIGLVGNFAQPAGWSAPISVIVVNDCGAPFTNAQVAASFSNGDVPFNLTPVGTSSGVFSGSWTPQNVSPQATVTVTVTAPGFPAASTQNTGQVTVGAAPFLAQNGTANAFFTQLGGGLAPGTIIDIYGSNLASGTAQALSAPLSTTLGQTSVLIGGIAAPLFYVAPGQINAQIPFELTAGNQYQVQVNNSGALSTPDSIQLAPVSPAIAALTDGQVIAQRYPDYSLVTEDAPAKPGDYLTIYLVGMGATDPAVGTGAASPGQTPAQLVAQPVLMVNGNSIPIQFAGMTPGAIGLYQINFQVPASAPDGDLTLIVSQAGMDSNTTVLPVKQ
jgi:uncharacterized protein (TIGR03437 family)